MFVCLLLLFLLVFFLGGVAYLDLDKNEWLSFKLFWDISTQYTPGLSIPIGQDHREKWPSGAVGCFECQCL